MPRKKPDLIDQKFVRALAHPLRAELLDMLGGERASPKDLAERMALPLSTVAYHIRVLFECNALDLIKERQRRGATEHIYRARPEAFIGARCWRKVPRSVRAGGVSAPVIQSFFDKTVRALEAGTIDARDDSTLNCMPLAVDEKGWKELALMMDKFLDLTVGIHERSAKRLAGADGISVVFGLAAFEAGPPNARPTEST